MPVTPCPPAFGSTLASAESNPNNTQPDPLFLIKEAGLFHIYSTLMVGSAKMTNMADKQVDTAEKYLRIIDSKKHILVNNFLGGISWALGTIVGFLIISIISVMIIGQTGVLSKLSVWFSDVIENSQKSVIPEDLENIPTNVRPTQK